MKKTNAKNMRSVVAMTVATFILVVSMLLTGCVDNTATPDQAQATTSTVSKIDSTTTQDGTTAPEAVTSNETTKPGTSSVNATEASNGSNSSSSSKPDNGSSSGNGTSGGGSSSSKPSSGGSGNSGSSGGSGGSGGNSSSDPHAGKTYHEAVYEDVWVVDQAAYSYEEPVYEERQITVCHVCGAEFDTSYGASNFYAHDDQHLLAGEGSGWHSEVRNVQTGTRTVNVPEEGHWEKKLVKEAGWY